VLAASAEAAWRLAGRLVSEELPERLVFRVRLNQSYDGNEPRPGELRFPADNAMEHAAELQTSQVREAVMVAGLTITAVAAALVAWGILRSRKTPDY
jgi:hypothetical protein